MHFFVAKLEANATFFTFEEINNSKYYPREMRQKRKNDRGCVIKINPIMYFV